MKSRTPQEFADAVRRQVLWMQTIAERKAQTLPNQHLRARSEFRAEAFTEILQLIDSEISAEPVPTPRPIGA